MVNFLIRWIKYIPICFHLLLPLSWNNLSQHTRSEAFSILHFRYFFMKKAFIEETELELSVLSLPLNLNIT
ncbi:hypothetical protein J6590_086858 [Homalodisca vitripennis]|nr:hypothetical protein J6590_086858 [Homalodisca vitripennis]